METISENTLNVSVNLDRRKAVLFAQLSQIAYVDTTENTIELERQLLTLGFTYIKTFWDEETDTEGYLAKNSDFAVICFRGTEEDPKDIFTDLDAKLAIDPRGSEHEGFFKAYSRVAVDVEQSLVALAGLPVYVAGHSLGGALAKVTILESNYSNFVACYTFGAPAVCNEIRSSQNKVPVFLIVNAADIVPRLLILGPDLVDLIQSLFSMLKSKIKGDGKGDQKEDKFRSDLEGFKNDLRQYRLFGTIYWFNREGEYQVVGAAELMKELFISYLTAKLQSAFEDHRIAEYIKVIGLK
jgi:hypothetical protein